MPSRRCSAFSSLCICSRSFRSSAPSGSSSSSTCGLADQRARQRHALALAARQLRGPALADAGQLHQRQQLVGAPRALASAATLRTISA